MVNTMVGVSLVGHAVHYAVLVGGLAGLVALLGPQLLGSTGRTVPPRDAHEREVLALRAALAQRDGASALGPVLRPVRDETPPASPPSPVRSAALGVVVVGSGAAALAHAAVGPEHFEEGALLGLFFVTSALLQLGWSVAVARRATSLLLLAGLVGNAAVITLWAATRTVGLPLGLLPEGPEAVGPWDSACLVWELAVVVGCALLLRRGGRPGPVAGWAQWPAVVRLWTVGSVVGLGVLSLIGHSA